ncbi:type IV pilus twitching motility protein PilT [Herbaspirillum huttiense]|uniref:type IV pilus twitching motility protein PilT n=1 Tax=Herbaspirillum huttiense TaxID=863372 RepID=UPI002176D64B|nr:ATPase, T2SS/T4P/T4SS family [Herbaspirillum huttiense]UWE18967.1 ATPase, T2SS/T4P/T4SS family [Herbaspirillum huttiense]
MANNSSFARDLQQELLLLLNNQKTFSDIHIEQDEPLMLKTPRGWQACGDFPVTLGEMQPLLNAIDEDWEDKIIDKAIDSPFILDRWRLRCNVFRMARGTRVAISIRRFPLEPMALENTGLPPYIKTILDVTKGLILITGPTGAGKTTTMASMLEYINATRHAHIVTIEEPIEYELQRKQSIISQKEVPTDTGSFSSGLREALRQKPDVLMVGEIRDFETADTVLHAGESGHLVLATLHTSSAVRAITKLLSFFPPDQRTQRAASLADSMIGVIFQSLLPSEDGEQHVMASEMVFNNNQQIAPFIMDPEKLPLIGDFMKRKEDNMSRTLNDVLIQLIAKKRINPRDALRIAYNRIELHEMLTSKR